MARRKIGSEDQGSLWALSYEVPEGTAGASNLILEKPDEQQGNGSIGDGGLDERPQISEPARQGRVPSMEVPPQGIGTFRFDWGAVAHTSAPDQGMLGVIEPVAEVRDVTDGGSGGGLSEDPGPQRNELAQISVPVFQAQAGDMYFATRSSAFDDAVAGSGTSGQMSAVTLRLRNPQIMTAGEVGALASDPANQLARHRNRQELDQKRMDLEYSKTLLPKVESAIQKRNEHEIRDGDGKLVSLKIVFNDQQFLTLKDATEYLKTRPKVDDDTLLEVNEIAIDINTRRATRTDLASGQMFTSTLVEYKLAGEWFDAPKGEIGCTTSAPSLVTSVLVRMRDLDQRAERIRESIEQSTVSIARLTLELEKPSAYSDSLKALNRRLDEVTAELLGEVKAEDVISDSNAVEREDAASSEALEGASGQDRTLIAAESGHDAKAVATFERHARKLVEQYGQGIEPGKADFLVAVKMAQGGWTPNQVTDGVRVAGFKTTLLQGSEMLAYAGKVSKQAVNAASKATEHSSLDHGRGIER